METRFGDLPALLGHSMTLVALLAHAQILMQGSAPGSVLDDKLVDLLAAGDRRMTQGVWQFGPACVPLHVARKYGIAIVR